MSSFKSFSVWQVEVLLLGILLLVPRASHAVLSPRARGSPVGRGGVARPHDRSLPQHDAPPRADEEEDRVAGDSCDDAPPLADEDHRHCPVCTFPIPADFMQCGACRKRFCKDCLWAICRGAAVSKLSRLNRPEHGPTPRAAAATAAAFASGRAALPCCPMCRAIWENAGEHVVALGATLGGRRLPSGELAETEAAELAEGGEGRRGRPAALARQSVSGRCGSFAGLFGQQVWTRVRKKCGCVFRCLRPGVVLVCPWCTGVEEVVPALAGDTSASSVAGTVAGPPGSVAGTVASDQSSRPASSDQPVFSFSEAVGEVSPELSSENRPDNPPPPPWEMPRIPLNLFQKQPTRTMCCGAGCVPRTDSWPRLRVECVDCSTCCCAQPSPSTGIWRVYSGWQERVYGAYETICCRTHCCGIERVTYEAGRQDGMRPRAGRGRAMVTAPHQQAMMPSQAALPSPSSVSAASSDSIGDTSTASDSIADTVGRGSADGGRSIGDSIGDRQPLLSSARTSPDTLMASPLRHDNSAEAEHESDESSTTETAPLNSYSRPLANFRDQPEARLCCAACFCATAGITSFWGTVYTGGAVSSYRLNSAVRRALTGRHSRVNIFIQQHTQHGAHGITRTASQ